ncbi:MAG: class I SAM-dependent RNA methyltransferase [Armatimonadota bacterium]
MHPTPDPTLLTVSIHGFATGGAAVGRVVGPEGAPQIGMAAFVPYAAPGETVTARIAKAWSRHLEMDLVDIGDASPDRVAPACSSFGECGGCQLQHVSEEAQRRARRSMVVDALRTGGLADCMDRVEETIAGPALGYRQRVTFHVDPDTGHVGYYRRRSHDLLVPERCPVVRPALETCFETPIELGPLAPCERGDLSVEEGEHGVFAVLTLSHPLSAGRLRAVVAALAARFTGGAVRCPGRAPFVYGETSVVRTVAGAETQSAPGGFAQANPAMNERLIAHVVGEADGARTACDLYAGSGNFTFPLAARGTAIVAVESDPELVASGRAEAARRSVAVRFHEERVEKYVRRSPSPVDFLLADPPRAGLDKAASHLGFARRLVLISCHLPSAIRDLKALRADGWEIARIVPFDMFPQTGHVEIATTLERSAPAI